MLDYIWAGMILIGILSAAFTGHMADVTNGAISSAREAVSTALTMLGVISLWTGLMKIGEKAGIVSSMCRKITPFLSRLFPSVPKESKAMEYIGINVIANFHEYGSQFFRLRLGIYTGWFKGYGRTSKIQSTQRKSNNGYVWLYDFQYVLTPVGICQSYCLQNTIQFSSTIRNYWSWNSYNPCINYYCNYF